MKKLSPIAGILVAVLVLISLAKLPMIAESEARKLDGDVIDSLILVDEESHGVLDLLEDLTGKTVLRQQDLPKVKINLNSKGSITKKDAILAIESLLSMNGIGIVDLGDNFMKAVPISKVKGEAPVLLEGSTLGLEPSQKLYSKKFTLQYLTTKEAMSMIKAIGVDKVSTQVALDKANAILAVDTLANLQRIEKLFQELDQPAAVTESIKFYPMQYSNAAEVVKILETFKKAGLKKYLQDATFVPDPSSNQVIVTTHPRNVFLIERMIKGMDKDSDPLYDAKVFTIQHANAKEVAALIKAVVKGIPEQTKDNTTEESDTRKKLLERLREAAGTSKKTESDKTVQFSQSLTVEPDERSNAVIAYGTPRDIELVADLIEKIDIVLAQVRIEVIIAEVDLDDDQVSGLTSFGIQRERGTDSKWRLSDGVNSDNIPLPVGFPALATSGVSAFTLTGTLKQLSMDMIFRKAQEDTNINILSAPMIVTTHNRKGLVKVVLDQPISKTSIRDGTNVSSLQTSTDYIEDVGIVLEVTPLIGPDGVIQMEIKQTVKSLGANVSIGNDLTAPQINNREAESYISVYDKEVIVLAGLQQRDSKYSKAKLFLLGDIPFVGDWLFSPKTKEEKTKEIVMFIQPHVIRNGDDAWDVTHEALHNTTLQGEVEQYLDVGHFPECDEQWQYHNENSKRKYWHHAHWK